MFERFQEGINLVPNDAERRKSLERLRLIAVVVPVLASASLDKDLQSQRLASATTQPSSVSTFFRPEGKSVSASFTFILMMESNIRM